MKVERLKGYKLKNPEIRFWNYVNKSSKEECWIWKGNKMGGPNPYGRIYVNGDRLSAHRYSYMINIGSIDKGKIICHYCDTPLCVNPSHLFMGTHKDNSRDMVSKGRMVLGRAKLTPKKVEEIKHSNEATKILALKYNVHPDTIRCVKYGRTWTKTYQSKRHV